MADLEVSVGVLLLEHEPERLLDINQEPSRRTRSDHICPSGKDDVCPSARLSGEGELDPATGREEGDGREGFRLTVTQSPLSVHQIVPNPDTCSSRCGSLFRMRKAWSEVSLCMLMSL